jgi:glucokinase
MRILGIEIGGTKLQLGVRDENDAELTALERVSVSSDWGPEEIRSAIVEAGRELKKRHEFERVGIGFGGPIDAATGAIVKSHQVPGWEGFPIRAWAEREFGVPAAVGNDSDLAGLAEAAFGAGRGQRVVYYTNCGSGIGGALVIDGSLYSGGRGIAVEPGHLRPGLACESEEATVEAIASGWGITRQVQAALREPADPTRHDVSELLEACGGDPRRLTTKRIAVAALGGNQIAKAAFERAAEVFGWAVAQAVTLFAPNVVVLGGGVPMADDSLFLDPVRRHVNRYVFPTFRGRFQILRARLGEEMVVHGAIALCASRCGR